MKSASHVSISETVKKRFNIVYIEDGDLTRNQLKTLLYNLPITFELIEVGAAPINYSNYSKRPMEVHHTSNVVSLYPPQGLRLADTILSSNNDGWKRAASMRPYNIMADDSGLSCSYRFDPRDLGVTGLDSDWLHKVQLDVHKFSHKETEVNLIRYAVALAHSQSHSH